MITRQDLNTAKFFTIFKGGKNVANVSEFRPKIWDLFQIDNGDTCDDQVIDYMSLEDITLMVDYEKFLEPEICLEAAGNAGIAHEVDDIDAALMALNFGFDLIKAPDNMYESYCRFYVLESENSKQAAKKLLENR